MAAKYAALEGSRRPSKTANALHAYEMRGSRWPTGASLSNFLVRGPGPFQTWLVVSAVWIGPFIYFAESKEIFVALARAKATEFIAASRTHLHWRMHYLYLLK
jgi:hypothetical protein